MAEEAQYDSHKRKYDEEATPPRSRRPSGFSDGPPPSAAPYGYVPPPLEDFELAKQKIQELANLAKRSKFENGAYPSNLNALSSGKSCVFIPSCNFCSNFSFCASFCVVNDNIFYR